MKHRNLAPPEDGCGAGFEAASAGLTGRCEWSDDPEGRDPKRGANALLEGLLEAVVLVTQLAADLGLAPQRLRLSSQRGRLRRRRRRLLTRILRLSRTNNGVFSMLS